MHQLTKNRGIITEELLYVDDDDYRSDDLKKIGAKAEKQFHWVFILLGIPWIMFSLYGGDACFINHTQ
jgi:hypothetical protein